MREITTHKVDGTESLMVLVIDEKGHGNANHEYEIFGPSEVKIASISFQNGPIKEHGINGVSDEAILTILIDRLEGFQAGDYACEENAYTLATLRAGLDSMLERTRARVARGAEGTSKV